MKDVLFPFPLRGKDVSGPVSVQPDYTSPDLQNVRPYDTRDNRARGGQRPGLSVFLSSALGAPVMALTQLTVTTYTTEIT